MLVVFLALTVAQCSNSNCDAPPQRCCKRPRHLSETTECSIGDIHLGGFFNCLDDISPFCEATGTQFLTYADIRPGFQSYGGFPCLTASSYSCNDALFAQIAILCTPTDLLVANMATEPL